MRVGNAYLSNQQVAPSETTTGATEAARRSGSAGQPLQETSTHSPSAELVQLVKAVRQTPEVRQDRLEEVAQRLASGFYLTPAAAEQTAEAMLKAAD